MDHHHLRPITHRRSVRTLLRAPQHTSNCVLNFFVFTFGLLISWRLFGGEIVCTIYGSEVACRCAQTPWSPYKRGSFEYISKFCNKQNTHFDKNKKTFNNINIVWRLQCALHHQLFMWSLDNEFPKLPDSLRYIYLYGQPFIIFMMLIKA